MKVYLSQGSTLDRQEQEVVDKSLTTQKIYNALLRLGINDLPGLSQDYIKKSLCSGHYNPDDFDLLVQHEIIKSFYSEGEQAYLFELSQSILDRANNAKKKISLPQAEDVSSRDDANIVSSKSARTYVYDAFVKCVAIYGDHGISFSFLDRILKQSEIHYSKDFVFRQLGHFRNVLEYRWENRVYFFFKKDVMRKITSFIEKKNMSSPVNHADLEEEQLSMLNPLQRDTVCLNRYTSNLFNFFVLDLPDEVVISSSKIHESLNSVMSRTTLYKYLTLFVKAEILVKDYPKSAKDPYRFKLHPNIADSKKQKEMEVRGLYHLIPAPKDFQLTKEHASVVLDPKQKALFDEHPSFRIIWKKIWEETQECLQNANELKRFTPKCIDLTFPNATMNTEWGGVRILEVFREYGLLEREISKGTAESPGKKGQFYFFIPMNAQFYGVSVNTLSLISLNECRGPLPCKLGNRRMVDTHCFGALKESQGDLFEGKGKYWLLEVWESIWNAAEICNAENKVYWFSIVDIKMACPEIANVPNYCQNILDIFLAAGLLHRSMKKDVTTEIFFRLSDQFYSQSLEPESLEPESLEQMQEDGLSDVEVELLKRIHSLRCQLRDAEKHFHQYQDIKAFLNS